MRWAMLDEVTEPVVACLEGRCVPAPEWAAQILAAHAAHAEAAGIGGAVSIPPSANYLDKSVWFCEYAAFAPPLDDAQSAELSGANLSYKTAALRKESDLLKSGAWETHLHIRWRNKATPLRTINAVIEFHNAMTVAEFVRQRFAYGRGYAAARAHPPRRWIFALVTPFLPFLLTLRTFLQAKRAGMLADFLLCLPAVFFFQTMWSAGELLGYCFGPSRRQSIY